LPFSSNNGKSFVDRAVKRFVKQTKDFFQHNRILDIGVGSGTYSDRYSTTWLPRTKFEWEGVEIWEPYIEKYQLKNKYDKLHVADALEVLNDYAIRFDIAFVGDVIEHMDFNRAVQFLNSLGKIASVVIISVPLGYYPQDEYDGNPYEKHLKYWEHLEVLANFPNVISWSIQGEIGVYICSTHPILKKLLAPQVGVYSIMKNEKAFALRMLKSVKDADFIVVCDTGSDDGTFEMLVEAVEERVVHHGHEEDLQLLTSNGETLGATDGEMLVRRVGINPWRFDDAKNLALTLLPEEIDVAISLDADEVMHTKDWYEILTKKIQQDLEKGGAPADRYHHRFKTVWNWADAGAEPHFSEHWHERIHSRSGYRWKLPVHEILVPKDLATERIVWMENLEMAQFPDMSKSRSSYLPLLKQSLAEDPTVWKSWTFYASELVKVGEIREAIEALKKALTIPDADQAFIHRSMSDYYRIVKDYPPAITEMQTAVVLAPQLREFKVYLANLYHELGEREQALQTMALAKSVVDRTYGYLYDPNCWGASFDAFYAKMEKV